MSPELSIIVVGYRSEKTIVPFLDSIKKNHDGVQKEIIVVDNYPADKGSQLAQKHPLKPIVIKNTENVGFSKAVNQGIKIAKGRYILLINPDTRVVGPSIKKLIDFAKTTPSVGAVAPRLLDPNGKPQASVYKFPTIWNAIRKDFFNCQKCFGKYLPDNRTQKVEVAIMAAFLIPKTTIDIVGGLNENYFLYYEDFDYCRKLNQNNLPVYYLPTAKVKHIQGASGNFTSHLKSPLLSSAKIYYGSFYSSVLNLVLWIGHKWQVILRRKRFRD